MPSLSIYHMSISLDVLFDFGHCIIQFSVVDITVPRVSKTLQERSDELFVGVHGAQLADLVGIKAQLESQIRESIPIIFTHLRRGLGNIR